VVVALKTLELAWRLVHGPERRCLLGGKVWVAGELGPGDKDICRHNGVVIAVHRG
jgi:hypothetical protein